MVRYQQTKPIVLSKYRLALEAIAIELTQPVEQTGTHERRSRIRAEIQAALKRIENGCYGTCLRCHRPIALMRLDAVPWAAFCIVCQEKVDALHARVYELGRRSA